MFMVTKVIARVHPVHWWMQTEHQVASDPQTKPIDLGCEFAENWLLPSTSTIAIVIIIQPISWYSFYHPTKGGRLCRPRHCSKGAQPVPKAIYRSSCVIWTCFLLHHSQTSCMLAVMVVVVVAVGWPVHISWWSDPERQKLESPGSRVAMSVWSYILPGFWWCIGLLKCGQPAGGAYWVKYFESRLWAADTCSCNKKLIVGPKQDCEFNRNLILGEAFQKFIMHDCSLLV